MQDLTASPALKLLIVFETSFLAPVGLSATQQSVLCKDLQWDEAHNRDHQTLQARRGSRGGERRRGSGADRHGSAGLWQAARTHRDLSRRRVCRWVRAEDKNRV